MQLYIQYIP